MQIRAVAIAASSIIIAVSNKCSITKSNFQVNISMLLQYQPSFLSKRFVKSSCNSFNLLSSDKENFPLVSTRDFSLLNSISICRRCLSCNVNLLHNSHNQMVKITSVINKIINIIPINIFVFKFLMQRYEINLEHPNKILNFFQYF